jgi:hypothetical protein
MAADGNMAMELLGAGKQPVPMIEYAIHIDQKRCHKSALPRIRAFHFVNVLRNNFLRHKKSIS